MPTAPTPAFGPRPSTSRIAAQLASHHSSGSCSAQPGCGVSSDSGAVAVASTPPSGATRMAFTPLVPTSRPRNRLPHSQEQLHRELVEPLVRVTALAECGEIEARLAKG